MTLSSKSTAVERGPHGLPTTDKPCPQCGATGHEVGMVLGLKSIFCPGVPFGEIRAVSPSETQTVGVDSADKAAPRDANRRGHGHREDDSQ